MKAIHRYRYNTPGVSHRERARRIAQSYGYKSSIQDNPLLVALLQRAGIDVMATPELKDQEVLVL